MNRAYGYASEEDMRRVTNAALKNEQKEYALGPIILEPHAVSREQVIVQVTGAAVAGDRRVIYPARFYVRNTMNPASGLAIDDWYGIGEGQAIPQLGNEVYVAGLNGETLTVGKKYMGKVAGMVDVPDPAHVPVSSAYTKRVAFVLVDKAAGGASIVRIVSPVVTNAYGEKSGYLQTFNTTTNLWVDGEAVWVRDANA